MSNADELIKLKELLDSGVLSQEEFDIEKEKLLNQDKSPDDTSKEVDVEDDLNFVRQAIKKDSYLQNYINN